MHPFRRVCSKIVTTIFVHFWQQRIPFLTVWSDIILIPGICYFILLYCYILLYTIVTTALYLNIMTVSIKY